MGSKSGSECGNDECQPGEVLYYTLHEHPEWQEQCATVLNEEWPRSQTARLHSLEKSCDGLPYCIVMVMKMSSGVVLSKSCRGKGLGRSLMENTETFAKRLGYNVVYLTTHDKQHFYGHLGYTYCDPVISLGAASKLLSQEKMERLFGKGSAVPKTTQDIRVTVPTTSPVGNEMQNACSQVSPKADESSNSSPQISDDESLGMHLQTTNESQPDNEPMVPPTSSERTNHIPSPPLAPSASLAGDHNSNAPPPPPPPPLLSPPPPPPLFSPPPPPPPPLLSHGNHQSQKHVPVRMDPRHIFWMKKVMHS